MLGRRTPFRPEDEPPSRGRVQVWDAATGEALHRFDVLCGSPYAFSPDGRLLLGTRHRNDDTPTEIVVMDVARGAQIAEVPLDRPIALMALCVGAGAEGFWTGEFYGSIDRWMHTPETAYLLGPHPPTKAS